MTTDFPTAPLAPGHKGAGGGAVEKSHHRLTHKKSDTPAWLAAQEKLEK